MNKTELKPIETTEDAAKDKPFPGDAPNQALATADATAGTALAEYDYGADAGSGFDNVSSDDYSIPIVRILDAKSPQCAPTSAGGLDVKAGSIFNTATNEIISGEAGMLFVPVLTEHKFVEWIKKEEDGSGGGFVATRETDDPLVLELRSNQGAFGKLLLPKSRTDDDKDHEIAETFYLYGLIVDPEGTTQRVVLPFASTQIKKYKAFVGRVMGFRVQTSDGRSITPAMWSHQWLFKSTYEKKGTLSWFGWRIGLKEEPPIKSRMKTNDPIFVEAKEFYASIKEGKVAIKHVDSERDEPGSDKDEIPM